jgi:2-oxoglutarate dehydrogenase E2 component (dihydrolipoamide succinyltransferase)
MDSTEIKVPSVGESITEVTLSSWLKADGDYVELDEPICEFESDKATLEFPAPVAGILSHVAAEGDDLEIGALIARIDTAAEKPAGKTSEKKDPSSTRQKTDEEQSGPPPAPSTTKTEASTAAKSSSPVAAKMLADLGLDASQVKGSGPEGRIMKSDVTAAIQQKGESPAAAPKPDAPRQGSEPQSRIDRREKMSRMRRTIARRLVSAKNNTAMLTTFNEVDMSAIFALRSKYQDAFVKKYGIKLGFMSLFAKACAQVLLEMPEVNAFIDGDDLVYHDYADIAIAISTPTGLVVPPVHNVESLGLHEIERSIKELAEKARDGKLSLEDMSGGTFTITNGGVFGSLMSTPIINEPQSAILGMHAIKERPVVVDGQIVVRPMMYLALSYDHRVIDGSSSVTFLVKVKELLEDPVRFVLGV